MAANGALLGRLLEPGVLKQILNFTFLFDFDSMVLQIIRKETPNVGKILHELGLEI